MKPVFLLEAEFDDKDISSLFGELGLKSAPLVVVVHPTKKKKITPGDKFVAKAKRRDEYDFNARGFNAEAVVQWINSKTGLDANVDRPIDWVSCEPPEAIANMHQFQRILCSGQDLP